MPSFEACRPLVTNQESPIKTQTLWSLIMICSIRGEFIFFANQLLKSLKWLMILYRELFLAQVLKYNIQKMPFFFLLLSASASP
jgi:hypothetical protein